MGFASFYRRFITSYPGITVPLTRLTRKDAPRSARCNVRTLFNSSKRPLLRQQPSTASSPSSSGRDRRLLLRHRRYSLGTHIRMVKFAPSRSSVAPYLVPSSTTTPTTRGRSPSSKLSRPGDIILCLLPYDRPGHGTRESGVLLFDKDAYASSSSLVGIPLRL